MKIVLKNIDKQNSQAIQTYGEYSALAKARELGREKILAEVQKSKLVGRGGAAFPTALKWEFVAKTSAVPKYVVCNADEGEPGTFKDRLILEKDPHLLLEGMAICAYTVGASKGFIYIRGEYFKAYKILDQAIKEARQKGYLGKDFDIFLYQGAGAYICGEETALLDSLEGKKGQSRVKPPFPTFEGYKNEPTVLNNVETLANIPSIVLNGGEWFSKIGSPGTPGTKIYCLSGDVKRPGAYELPTDITLRELIENHGKGTEGKIKAILPGGVSSSFLTTKDLDVTLDYPSVASHGSMLGSGAVIVLNEKHCLVDIAKRCIHFFTDESCGKCTPCREGTKRAKEILVNICQGRGAVSDLELLLELQEVLFDTSRCGLGQAALNAVRSAIEKFRSEFEEHLKGKCGLGVCPMGK